MSKTLNYQNRAPALLPLYARAIIPKGGAGSKNGDAVHIPPLTATLTGITTDRERLARYQRVCGFASSSIMPITWPHIEAFPLHIRLMTDAAFPLPLLGLVHLRNSITQHRPIYQGECLDIECTLTNQVNGDRGIEFDVLTTAFSSGRCVWEESSTILFRQASSGGSSKGGARTPPEKLTHERGVSAPGDIGRRYGKVSGDLNPIHLHALSAKAFGFPRAIAHGMWSKAHCLAVLGGERDFHQGAVRAEAAFKTPLLLPGTASLSWDQNGNEWPFRLLNAKGTAPHLEGSLHWLD